MLGAMRQAFGCRRCYGEDPERVWAYVRGLLIERELVDESHFIVQLRRCAECRQQVVWIFPEQVGWKGGEGGQYRNVVPVSSDEADSLAGQEVDLQSLAALGRHRRYLETTGPPAPADSGVNGQRASSRSGHDAAPSTADDLVESEGVSNSTQVRAVYA